MKTVMYLSGAKDPQMEADVERLAKAPMQMHVVVCGLRLGGVRYAVQRLVKTDALVVPDDFHRHTLLVERVKACARMMDMDVFPLTRFLTEQTRQHPPAPAHTPVHATHTEPAGAGSGMEGGSAPG